MRVHHSCITLVLSGLFVAGAASGAVYRVRSGATGTPHDGSTWDRAYTTVQAGINAASSNDEVWVAQGTYVENLTTKDGVKLRGGYAGAGASPDARDYSATPSILDGNHAGSVLQVPAYAGSGTVIEGFSIRNGTGTAPSGSSVYGGAVYCQTHASPSISFCLFSNNQASPANWPVGRGGAIYTDPDGRPNIDHCRFANNSALYGGAVFVSGGTISNSYFESDTAVSSGGALQIEMGYTVYVTGNSFTACSAASYGGAIDCDAASTVIMSNIFDSNVCSGSGGAVHQDTAVSRMVSNVFVGNKGGSGDAIYSDGNISVLNNTFARQARYSTSVGDAGALYIYTSGPVYNNIFLNNDVAICAYSSSYVSVGQFHNNCFYGNASDHDSRVPNIIGVNSNFDGDPKLVDAANNDFHERADSPCADAGDAAHKASSDTDMDGQARVFGPAIDIGADEFEPVMAFSTQPGDGHKGSALSRQPVIALRDGLGNAYPATNGSVTVAMTAGTGTSGAALTGTTTVAFTNGIAAFTNLAVDTGGTGYTLTATCSGLANITSTVFDVTIPRVYVSTTGTDANEGGSWADSKLTIAAALDGVDRPGEVWVRRGTYTANETLPASVALYGGFRGGETNISQRHPETMTTTLSGSLSAPVITIAAGSLRTTILDGFTITGGAGALLGTFINQYHAGGGIYCKSASPTITHNYITDNSATIGGGIYVDGGSPLIQYNRITLNSVACTGRITAGGGGISLIGDTTASVLDNLIGGNTGTGTNPLLSQGALGGGIGCLSSDPAIRNNTLVGNSATGPGGAVYLNAASPALTNNIIARHAKGLYAENSSHPTFSHNDFWDNDSYNVYGVTNPIGTNGNISAEPMFADPGNADFHIARVSPCVNAGSNSGVAEGEEDLDGHARIIGGTADIGAYEVYAYTTSDASRALRIAAGIYSASHADVARLDIWPDSNDSRITLEDGVRVARKVAGVEANP